MVPVSFRSEIAMDDIVKSKANELRNISCLGKRLDEGDDSELVIWVIPSVLACAHRPSERLMLLERTGVLTIQRGEGPNIQVVAGKFQRHQKRTTLRYDI